MSESAAALGCRLSGFTWAAASSAWTEAQEPGPGREAPEATLSLCGRGSLILGFMLNLQQKVHFSLPALNVVADHAQVESTAWLLNAGDRRTVA